MIENSLYKLTNPLTPLYFIIL